MSVAPVYIIVIILSLLSLGLFKSPIKAMFKWTINSFLGFIALLGFNFLGSYVGISIAVNFFNALIIGILGPFGVLLILILSYIL